MQRVIQLLICLLLLSGNGIANNTGLAVSNSGGGKMALSERISLSDKVTHMSRPNYESSTTLNLSWIKQKGAPVSVDFFLNIAFPSATAVSTVSDGSVYVAGYTDEGLSGQKLVGSQDYFIAKYDESSNLLWVKQVGASGGMTKAHGVSADISGNIYVVGSTTKGISGQAQSGESDSFIAKYDSKGSLIWTRQLGMKGGYTDANGVSADNLGNIYVTGFTTVGLNGQKQFGYKDYFIAKYDASGNLLWSKQLGASYGDSCANGISSDNNGNIYIAGYTTVGLSAQKQNGSKDYFIARYDADGNRIWLKQVGANGGSTIANGVSILVNGEVYIAGNTTVGISGQTQHGYGDCFVSQYNSSGNLLWTRQVGASGGQTVGQGISADNSGNTYITGQTDVGISGHQQNGIYDYFTMKLDTNGNLIWTRQIGADGGFTDSYGVSTDSNGNSYIVGSTTVGLSGQQQIGRGRNQNYFIAKYNQSGVLGWSKQVGLSSAGQTYAQAIAADKNGNIYMAGYSNVQSSSSIRGTGAFLAKYDAWGNLTWMESTPWYGSVIAKGVSTDNSGNVYVAGYTDEGTGIYDYVLAKYDPLGNIMWLAHVGVLKGTTEATAVSTDSANNIYVTGYTDKALPDQTKAGLEDYFIAKYDQYGSLLWTREVGAVGGITEANGVSIDSHGMVYIVGVTDKGISGQAQNGLNDYFIAQYDNSGNLEWTKQVGISGGNTEAYGVVADSYDSVSVYVVGGTTKGISGQVQTGNEDYFIARYDIEGNPIWTKQVGALAGITQANGVSEDSSGTVYVVGQTNVGISGQHQTGYIDYFIAKYDSTDLLLSTEQRGSSCGSYICGYTGATGVTVDSSGNNVYVSGYTNSPILSGESQTGGDDYFITKYTNLYKMTF